MKKKKKQGRRVPLPLLFRVYCRHALLVFLSLCQLCWFERTSTTFSQALSTGPFQQSTLFVFGSSFCCAKTSLNGQVVKHRITKPSFQNPLFTCESSHVLPESSERRRRSEPSSFAAGSRGGAQLVTLRPSANARSTVPFESAARSMGCR